MSRLHVIHIEGPVSLVLGTISLCTTKIPSVNSDTITPDQGCRSIPRLVLMDMIEIEQNCGFLKISQTHLAYVPLPPDGGTLRGKCIRYNSKPPGFTDTFLNKTIEL